MWRPGSGHGVGGRIQDSLSWLNARILEAPMNPDRYADRAAFHLRRGELGEAMDDLALVVQADSTRLDARQTLGELRFGVRDFEGAVREWEGALRVDDQFAPALLSLAKVDVLLRSYDPALKRINAPCRWTTDWMRPTSSRGGCTSKPATP